MIHLQYLLNFLQIIILFTLHNQVLQIIQHVLSTQSQQTILRTLPYTPAQTSNLQASTFTMNTIQTNPRNHQPTSRKLSRPPLSHTPKNPLLYNVSSTNINNIQQPSTMSHTQFNTLQMNSVSTSQIPQIPSTTIRTNPYI